MRNSVLRDFAGILLVYGIYAILTVLLYGVDRFSGDQIETLPLIMIAVSLMCMLSWYVLGEWAIKPHAPASTWYTVWFLLLAVIIAMAAYVSFTEGALANSPGHTDVDSYPWLHFLGGIGFYYLASVLFSPTFGKYLIWPAKHIRTW